jgi:hypothetical protein
MLIEDNSKTVRDLLIYVCISCLTRQKTETTNAKAYEFILLTTLCKMTISIRKRLAQEPVLGDSFPTFRVQEIRVNAGSWKLLPSKIHKSCVS